MASLAQAAMWLINQGTEKVLGPEPRYWQYGTTLIPRNEYHQIVILVTGDYSITVKKAIAENFENQARNAGFRLLKVQPAGDKIQFEGMDAHLFTGFVASDVWAKTGNELSSVLNGAPLVWDSQEVGLAEAASLDALWIAGGELEKEISDITVTPEIQINYWPLVGGAALIISAGFLLHTIFTKAFKGAQA